MITLKRITDKLTSLMKEWDDKRHYFNMADALIFTAAPYTHYGNERKHESVIRYLDRYAPKEFAPGYSLSQSIEDNSRIWVFWYQGFDSATPPIVKYCYQTVLDNSNGHEVVLLTKSNLGEYISLPDYVWWKVERGIITLTHLSDLVRMALLSEYGGYWIDGTIMLTAPLPMHNTPYYTIKGQRPNPRHVEGGNLWSAFFIGTGKKNAVAKYILDIFLNYWKAEERMIDYFLVDYSVAMAYRRFPEFRDIIDSNPADNASVCEMQSHLDDEYSSEQWAALTGKCVIHKLSYKIPLRQGNTIGQYLVEKGRQVKYVG